MKQSLKFHLTPKSSTLLHAPQTTLPEGVSRSAIRDSRSVKHTDNIGVTTNEFSKNSPESRGSSASLDGFGFRVFGFSI